jgi:hypothetical protein
MRPSHILATTGLWLLVALGFGVGCRQLARGLRAARERSVALPNKQQVLGKDAFWIGILLAVQGALLIAGALFGVWILVHGDTSWGGQIRARVM